MNTVDRARRDVLTILVIEAAKQTGRIPDIVKLGRAYHLKHDDQMVKSAVNRWEERGWLIISRLLDGSVVCGLKPSCYADALAEVFELWDASVFSISWEKEELLTDADQNEAIPIRDGWKLLFVEPDASKRNEPSLATEAAGVSFINNFAPTNMVEAPKSSQIPTWIGILVALAIGLVTIAITKGWL